MREANSIAPNTELRWRKRHRTPQVLAGVMLDLLDRLCDGTHDYAQFRDAVKPILDEVAHGKR